MKHLSWQVLLALILIALSALFYYIHYIIFGDPYNLSFNLLGNIAFTPIQVLFVTLIINQLLVTREKRVMLEKLNMLIGAFFSEIGTGLLIYFSDFDPKLDEIKKDLIVTNDWSEQDFSNVSKRLRKYNYEVDIKKLDLEYLRNLLVRQRDFLVRLLENPNLLEHESFTEVLRAAFHLTEELASRKDIKQLPETDYEHLAGDIKRIYALLVLQWLDYMGYLKGNYPYLFSLAMRTNPFDEKASPLVT